MHCRILKACLHGNGSSRIFYAVRVWLPNQKMIRYAKLGWLIIPYPAWLIIAPCRTNLSKKEGSDLSKNVYLSWIYGTTSLGPRPNQPQHGSLLVSLYCKRYTRWINGLGSIRYDVLVSRSRSLQQLRKWMTTLRCSKEVPSGTRSLIVQCKWLMWTRMAWSLGKTSNWSCSATKTMVGLPQSSFNA